MPDPLYVLLAHLAGDYVLQSHWMATEKTTRWWPAIVHGFFYTLPHLLLTTSLPALTVIGGTHIVLDRTRAAKYVIWAKNQLGAAGSRPTWAEAKDNCGFPRDVSAGLAQGLLIVVDNTLHLAINVAALYWLG
ncbi:DUF3307 domain-containing protein [Nonomuraea turkmeniaca]|uniref:DUF3307 domain-containing protein n=1 Tax=Nonomuraea turkmeniaca TaxID=103838 RepID=A0A5S4FN82_9ACTN|nr:DUF3307 domain-containing protein [Nonomuraea turkmeniaca]TMR22089.1 DUF3307 domain-containing protein [Nonomuraea turkmeniaca]